MEQTRPSSRKEQPSTYMVQDRSNQEELLRLDAQDHLFNTAMRGVLSEQADPSRFRSVLDVACGTGGWLIETAQSYPAIEYLRGVDISLLMIEYARTKAEAAQVSDRVSFQVGDALKSLAFPLNTFDLVNQRLGMSFLRKWDWPLVFREYQRICKPGGIIRITEGAILIESTSPALTRLGTLCQEAFYQSGHLFTNQSDGIIVHLAEQMEQYGIVDVQTRTYTFDYHADTQTLQAFARDIQRFFRTTIPYLKKWTDFPQNYEDLYQQLVQETSQPDFQATHTLMTAWGTNRVNKLVSRSE